MGICIYHKKCEFFERGAHTCNDNDEAKWYCGKYRQFVTNNRHRVIEKINGLFKHK